MMTHVRISVLVVLIVSGPLGLTAGGAAANPACPLSTVRCEYVSVTSTDSTASCDGCLEGCARARYDLPHGTFGLEIYYAFDGAVAGVTAVDEYRVGGIPVGTPVSFTAEMDVSAHLGGYCYGTHGTGSSASASLREGESNGSYVSISTPMYEVGFNSCARDTSLAQTLRVSIVRFPGEVFTLHFSLSSFQLKNQATLSGRLRFSGLPPGASVVSCQGYRQDFATASLPVTWGQLKARYR